jgi:hypothetical protein
MEPTTITECGMNVGDIITLRQAEPPNESVEVMVSGVLDGETLCSLRISCPPPWFRQMLAGRGIFIGPASLWNLTLFADHKGQWTDTQMLGHYVLSPTP